MKSRKTNTWLLSITVSFADREACRKYPTMQLIGSGLSIIARRLFAVKWNTSSGSWSVSLDTPKRHIADCRRTQIGYMRCSSAPISTCWHVQDGLSKNLRSPDKGVLCPFGPLGADYRESESRKGSGKAAFAYRFVNCNEISVINQRFPKVTARKRKF